MINTSGGTLNSTDSQLSLSVPPGAVDTPTTIRVTIVEATSGNIGPTYQIDTPQADDVAFQKPVTITLAYDPKLLPPGVNEEHLQLAILGPFDSWIILEDTKVDTVHHILTATATHFSPVAKILGPAANSISPGSRPKLRFPLAKRTPYDPHIINTVYDHSRNGPSYTGDGIIKAYTGDIAGRGVTGEPDGINPAIINQGTPKEVKLYCYRHYPDLIDFASSFPVYRGACGDANYMAYDGHPAYDYRTRDTDQDPVNGHVDVFASADGILRLGNSPGIVRIEHESGYSTLYIHLFAIETQLVGKTVTAGTKIGVAGDVGAKGSPHLHFEVRRNNVPIDPYAEQLWEIPHPPGAFGFSAAPQCTTDGSPQILLTWTRPALVDFFQVLRDGVVVVGQGNTSYLDSSVALGTTYSYQILAINSSGQLPSKILPITARCDVPPGKVTLTVAPICQGSSPANLLEWTGSIGNTKPYEVRRGGSQLVTTDSSRYLDVNVTPGLNYTYFVRAANQAGTTDSDPITAQTKSDCSLPTAPSLTSLEPNSVTIGQGGFTLILKGNNFDSTNWVLWGPAGQPPQTPIKPQLINSTQLNLDIPQDSSGFSTFPGFVGDFVLAILRPGPNFLDGLRSQPKPFAIYNPSISAIQITGQCRAGLDCTPPKGFDVRITALQQGGFVANSNINSFKSSTTATIKNPKPGSQAQSTPISLLGTRPVSTTMQLVVNNALIPVPGQYQIELCNSATAPNGTPCATSQLTVSP